MNIASYALEYAILDSNKSLVITSLATPTVAYSYTI